MKKKLALLAAPVIVLAASSNVHAHWGVTPYVGADVQYRDMDFQSGFGQNLLSHHQPQGNFYLGAKFHEHFGIEAGFESTNKQSRTAMLTAGDVNLGITTAAGARATYVSTGRINGPHLSVVGFTSLCDENRVKVMGLLGIASLKATFNVVNTLNTAAIAAPLELSQRKTVLRLGAGLEHMLNCDWGIRATVIWENTDRIQAPTPLSRAVVKPKNSFVSSLGVFVSF